MAAEEGQQAPRQQQTILEIYVKIGAFVGTGLAIGAFVATCAFSYWVFGISHLSHLNNRLIDFLIIFGTLICASVVGITTLFCASIYWLPIVLGMIGIALVVQNLLIKYHQMHH